MISEGGISVGEETSRIPVVIIQFYQLFQLSESATTRKRCYIAFVKIARSGTSKGSLFQI